MVVAAFIFGIALFALSLFFLLLYVRGNSHMQENHNALARQRQRQLEFQADLEARMDAEARKYEEARQALLKHKGGDDAEPRKIGRAASYQS